MSPLLPCTCPDRVIAPLLLQAISSKTDAVAIISPGELLLIPMTASCCKVVIGADEGGMVCTASCLHHHYRTCLLPTQVFKGGHFCCFSSWISS